MRRVYHVLLGLLLAGAMWVALDLSQNVWAGAVATLLRPADPAVPMVTLLVTGAALGLVIRIMPATSLWIAAGLLLAVLAPLAAGLGSWWPEALPGNPLSLGVHAGTYLALGVLLAGACVQTIRKERLTDLSQPQPQPRT